MNFPKNTKDKSLKVAYHALIHREADDNLRAQDIEYREEQDDYLEFLAETLQKGESVPKNIIKEYEAWYPETTLPYSDSIKDLLKKLCKFLNV